jgi:hypothetical protein
MCRLKWRLFRCSWEVPGLLADVQKRGRCCRRYFTKRSLLELCGEMFGLHATCTGDLGALWCR